MYLRYDCLDIEASAPDKQLVLRMRLCYGAVTSLNSTLSGSISGSHVVGQVYNVL